ncbi:MAG: HD domain-containing protein [Candidatus Gastranaerophilaceae bacterium]
MNIQTLTDKIKNDDILNNLSAFSQNKVYLVGGSVRDAIMGKDYFDRDIIVTDSDAREFSLKVAEFFDGVFIPLDEINNIYRVVLKDKINYLDITNPVGGSLENDILRRDLTINAVAADIKTGDIPDCCVPYVEDIYSRRLVSVKESNFFDDPLRLLRIFRFYSLLGFDISSELTDIAKKYSNLILNPAKERVEYELIKLFCGEFSYSALLKMDEVGILELLFPFVKELKQVPPNPHHHLDLFHHSVETVNQLTMLYKNSSTKIKEHLDRVDFGGFSRFAHLKLAAFMHDIGKFSTWTIEPDTGRHRFIKHDDVGAKLAADFLKSMKFSNKQINYITYIIKKHMYPTAVVSSPDLNEKIMMRYLRKSEDKAIDNILIAMADRLSARGPEITDEIVAENITLLSNLLEFCIEKQDLKPLPKLLDGNDLIDLFGLKPSPKLGQLLNLLHEAQISGDVSTRDEAIEFIKTLL